jgi:serine protease Do
MKWPAFISEAGAATLAVSAALGAATMTRAGLLESIDKEVSAIYERSKPAVVKIHAQRQPVFGNLPLLPSHRVGTGFFIDGEGRIVTAATVVQDAHRVWIDWHGREVEVKILGRDEHCNLALLKVEPAHCTGPERPTPALPLGDSERLRIGSMVIAVGFPYDLPSAPAVGFVSGFDIRRGERMFLTRHIRASCRLSPGQGGGPLLNTQGEVVGIVVAAHLDDQCYAFPINAARTVCFELSEHGRPRRGWVGLGISERQLPATEPGGEPQWQVYVERVYSNTPAERAGFRDHDVLLSVAGRRVCRSADVLDAVFPYREGDAVSFSILRDGEPRQLTLTMGARPRPEPMPAAAWPPPLLPQRPGTTGPVLVPATESR